MTGLRSTGFVVSFGVLAFIVCSVAIQRQFERHSRSMATVSKTDWTSRHSDASPILPLEFLDHSDLTLLRTAIDTVPLGDIVPALQVQEGDDREQTLRAGNPTVVPAPVDAVPVETPQWPAIWLAPTPAGAPVDAVPVKTPQVDDDSSSTAANSAVRDVIERELAHAPREERDIWFDELKTLPAGVVRDLLQVRKQLRALPRLLGGIPEKLASTDPSLASRTREIAAEPASQKIRFNLPDYYSASVALEAAISQLRHNLTNAATPGFKRLRVTLVDSYSSTSLEPASPDEPGASSSLGTSVHGEGCRIAPLQLDLKQGLLKKTGRQLDLAIDGEGFFVVLRGGKELLTRCGAFTLDHDRQLCLSVADNRVLIQPTIAVPDDARESLVSADGMVSYLKSGEATLTVIGQLRLARVASPARLQPAGQTLFVANENSGRAVIGEPMANGFGELQQGFLEQSNVDFQTELDEIEELMLILKALPFPNSRPVTASSPQQTPTR